MQKKAWNAPVHSAHGNDETILASVTMPTQIPVC